MNLECFEGPHATVVALSVIGLVVWTIAPLVAICVTIRQNMPRLSEPDVRRELAYFVDGYALHSSYCSYWDVLVKRADLLLTICIASTSLVPDDKAKILFFTVQSGFFLWLHSRMDPFDSRRGRLLDRLEHTGLLVRFFTFAGLQLLLVFSSAMPGVTLVAVVILILNWWFSMKIGMHVFMELAVQIGGRYQEVKVNPLRRSGSRLGSQTSNAKDMVQRLVGRELMPLLSLPLQFLRKVKTVEHNALSIEAARAGALSQCKHTVISTGSASCSSYGHHDSIKREDTGGTTTAAYDDGFDSGRGLCSEEALLRFRSVGDHQHRECEAAVLAGLAAHAVGSMVVDGVNVNLQECFLAIAGAWAVVDAEQKKLEEVCRHLPSCVTALTVIGLNGPKDAVILNAGNLELVRHHVSVRLGIPGWERAVSAVDALEVLRVEGLSSTDLDGTLVFLQRLLHAQLVTLLRFASEALALARVRAAELRKMESVRLMTSALAARSYSHHELLELPRRSWDAPGRVEASPIRPMGGDKAPAAPEWETFLLDMPEPTDETAEKRRLDDMADDRNRRLDEQMLEMTRPGRGISLESLATFTAESRQLDEQMLPEPDEPPESMSQASRPAPGIELTFSPEPCKHPEGMNLASPAVRESL